MNLGATELTINGSKVSLYPMRDVRAVLLKAVFYSGSWTEKGDNWGAMHFLEHLTHNGTKKFASQLDIELFKEEYGIQGNAFTGSSTLGYWYEFPETSLEAALTLFEEIVFKPKLSEAEYERELKVISQEYADKWSNPYNRFSRASDITFYGKNHLYIRDGIGQPEYLTSLTQADMTSIHKKHFVTNNMILSVVGSFNEKRGIAKLERLLTSQTQGKKQEFKLTKPLREADYLWHKEDVDQVLIRLHWTTPGREILDLHTMLTHSLAAYLIGGSSRSLLYRRLRFDTGLVYSTGARWGTYPIAGVFSAYASTNQSDSKLALEIMRSTVDEFASTPVASDDFERGKRYIATQHLLSYDSVENIADAQASDLFWERRVISPEERIAELNTITPQEVQLAVAQFLKKEPFLSVLARDEPELF